MTASANGMEWAKHLLKCPQDADACPWDVFDDVAWHFLLMARPEFADRCRWEFISLWEDDELKRWYLATLIARHPQFADKCNWAKFDGRDIEWILQNQPNLAPRADLHKLNGGALAELIKSNPELVERVSWDEFHDWPGIIGELDGEIATLVIGKCDFSKFTAMDWVALIEKSSVYASKCDWRKLDASAWQELLYLHPEYRAEFDKYSELRYDDLHVDQWEPF